MHLPDPLQKMIRATVLASAALFSSTPAHALQASDYQRAERVHDSHLRGALRNASVLPNWLPDGRFWYEREDAQGRRQAVLVDPATARRQILFEPTALDTAVAPFAASGPRLRLASVQVVDAGLRLRFNGEVPSIASGHAGNARARRIRCRRPTHCLHPLAMRGCRCAATIYGCTRQEPWHAR